MIRGAAMRRRKQRRQFDSEAGLCSAFLEALERQYANRWKSYAETEGWDILLVRQKDGFQIGIQAKLALNIAVVNQCLEYGRSTCEVGPDCRAVLVPSSIGNNFQAICRYIGLTIVGVSREQGLIEPRLPGPHTRSPTSPWHEWCPVSRYALPAYVPDVVAGAKAPVRLTTWKIKALKLAALIELRGRVSRADFKHLGLDPRRWTAQGGWLLPTSEGYIESRRTPKFAEQHPTVFAQIKSDFTKWAPPPQQK
jgi:hypothetical protein